MSDDKALVPIHNEMTLKETMTLGDTLAKSGFFDDAKDAAKAVAKILAGRELGFGPMASMTGIHIIQGKIAVGANLMGASVKRDPRYDYRVVKLTDDHAEIAFYENGKELGRSVFTMQDASAAGLNGKDNWRKFARNMLFSRAMSNGVRWYCPDAFGGNPTYTPDELGAEVDDEGSVVEGQFSNGHAEPEPQIIDLGYVPDYDTLPEHAQWPTLRALAVKHLGYDNDFHVKNTLKQVFNGESDNLTLEAAWQVLVDHQRAKEETAE